ncbi:uncharacterized protein LOC109724675 isoform X2 [Ananas comosus]|uniref:Uncharacterized protein LOC109724675 isoform X2 n=1 Tax=Ananas comosus TaxID=4615 RepID=A0A6P5GMZ6_ANACO|nr:uncharacterized protein LOC109724675 isoform X2 [Ananas comosus]
MISNFRIHISSVSIFRRRGKNKRIWKRNMEYRCRYDLSTLLICIRFHSYLMLSLFLKAANVINSIELQATHKLFARDYMQSCQDYCIWFIQYVIYLVFQHNKRCKITPKILPKGGGGGCVYWITEGEYCCTLLSLSLARTPILFYYFVLPDVLQTSLDLKPCLVSFSCNLSLGDASQALRLQNHQFFGFNRYGKLVSLFGIDSVDGGV